MYGMEVCESAEEGEVGRAWAEGEEGDGAASNVGLWEGAWSGFFGSREIGGEWTTSD